MTRDKVESTIARLKFWVRAADSFYSCRHDGSNDCLDDLEALRQHDEAQAAAIAEADAEHSRLWNRCDNAEQLLLDFHAVSVRMTKLVNEIEERRACLNRD